ncbi:phage antirepressor KilAC domain-containing protein [Catalinimonas sp. 4WD22]|uniref:phage antirepressor KilAC domain-containing protein n=1 Tax=Catalinimonas locisalis TaxID=3133978 RepID=UPI00310186AE
MNYVTSQTGSTDLVYHTSPPQEQLLSGRQLHAELNSNKDFTTWMKYQIDRFNLEEGRDYIVTSIDGGNPNGGRKELTEYGLKSITYQLIKSSDTGTEGMRTRCELISKATEYDKLMNSASLFQNPEFFRSIANTLEENQKLTYQNQQLESDNKKMQPAFEYCQDVKNTDDLFTIQEVSKLLNFKGVGPNKLFEILRNERILQSGKYKNQPYSSVTDRFILREYEFYGKDDKVRIGHRTYATMRGKAYCSKLLKRLGYTQKHKSN